MIADRIKLLREQAGMTQAGLAKPRDHAVQCERLGNGTLCAKHAISDGTGRGIPRLNRLSAGYGILVRRQHSRIDRSGCSPGSRFGRAFEKQESTAVLLKLICPRSAAMLRFGPALGENANPYNGSVADSPEVWRKTGGLLRAVGTPAPTKARCFRSYQRGRFSLTTFSLVTNQKVVNENRPQ